MKKTAFLSLALLLAACGGSQKSSTGQESVATSSVKPVGPAFQTDSAYEYCRQQCAFGPRTMNSRAHDDCAQWIVQQFQRFGLDVIEQRATLTGFDGTPLLANNIIASYRPDAQQRVMFCAHWDSRPWADNDPDPANHQKPVMAANDGASGIAVMLELARLAAADSLALGLDFVCFDAEDWGSDNHPDSWALGAQHWARNPHRQGYRPRYAILLDMVGGQRARFYREGFSMSYAPQVVERVWRAAEAAGYGSFFPRKDGGYVTDDHGPVNETARIPCIDIIPNYPDCDQSSFGPTWHTVNDDMDHIDPATLQAVGQTLVQLLWSE